MRELCIFNYRYYIEEEGIRGILQDKRPYDVLQNKSNALTQWMTMSVVGAIGYVYNRIG